MATARQSAADRDVLRMKPGPHPVVTCYLKLEPRDRARKKYLTKLKNRVKQLEYALPSFGWDRKGEEAIRADFARILDYLSDVTALPATQGIAIFASKPQGLFDVQPLPRVHRSRLVVDRTPLVRELAATKEEFGRLFTVTLDRATALIWEVTSTGAKVVRKVASDITRGGRFHARGAGFEGSGEYRYHTRIRDEKRRHLEQVARALFETERREPGHQIVIAGAGNDAAALEPYLHSYLADRLIGLARLAPKDATPAAVHQLTMEVREHHARASEMRHVEELAEALGTGWAVNGVRETLKALSQGQVRLLLVSNEATAPGFRSMETGRLSTLVRDLREDGKVVPTLDVIDDGIEEALRQNVALDVIYDPQAAEAVDGLAGLLRFK
jgi:peptide chain release factor subunit 1